MKYKAVILEFMVLQSRSNVVGYPVAPVLRHGTARRVSGTCHGTIIFLIVFIGIEMGNVVHFDRGNWGNTCSYGRGCGRGRQQEWAVDRGMTATINNPEALIQ